MKFKFEDSTQAKVSLARRSRDLAMALTLAVSLQGAFGASRAEAFERTSCSPAFDASLSFHDHLGGRKEASPTEVDLMSVATIWDRLSGQVAAQALRARAEKAAEVVSARAKDAALAALAVQKGVPQYIKRKDHLIESRTFLEYDNFGQLGLAELKLPANFNFEQAMKLNSGRPLIVLANHPLGVADGLALQALVSKARPNQVSALLLADWIKRLLPEAVYEGPESWGRAIPVDISHPDPNAPNFAELSEAIQKVNAQSTRTALKVLRANGAIIIFPAGHVSSFVPGLGGYPNNVQDAPGSWMPSALALARIAKADIVFAHINTVNNKSFYENRKRFGGGNRERIIWFISEAVKLQNRGVNIALSTPMSLEQVVSELNERFKGQTILGTEVDDVSEATLKNQPEVVMEMMRRYTYQSTRFFPQQLDSRYLPQKLAGH